MQYTVQRSRCDDSRERMGETGLPRDGDKDVRRRKAREGTMRRWILPQRLLLLLDGAARKWERNEEKDLFAEEPLAVAKISWITLYNYERWLHLRLVATHTANLRTLCIIWTTSPTERDAALKIMDKQFSAQSEINFLRENQMVIN